MTCFEWVDHKAQSCAWEGKRRRGARAWTISWFDRSAVLYMPTGKRVRWWHALAVERALASMAAAA